MTRIVQMVLVLAVAGLYGCHFAKAWWNRGN